LIIVLGVAALVVAAWGLRAIPDIIGPVFLAVVLVITVDPIRGVVMREHRARTHRRRHRHRSTRKRLRPPARRATGQDTDRPGPRVRHQPPGRHRRDHRTPHHQLESQLSGADITLTTDILDRIDELVAPGVTVNPDDNSYGEAELTPTARRRDH
jgi:hypothetical protein